MEKEFITAQEVTELLGISIHTVKKWRQNGRLPSYKISPKKVVFDKQELINWALKAKVKR